MRCFDEYPDEPSVLAGLQALYAQTGRGGQFAAKLEERRRREPRAFNLAMRLALAHVAAGNLSEASRVLDAARAEAAAGGEPDVLYSLSHLYDRAGQRPTAEEVLQQVLKLDPSHAGANNDLGYGWAEQGRNLPQAEALTRAAVEAEPDNPSLLDSLAWVSTSAAASRRPAGPWSRRWVLKDTAQRSPAPQLDSANADKADPVVLDHMGDVLYRLNDRDAAAKVLGAIAKAARCARPGEFVAGGPQAAAAPASEQAAATEGGGPGQRGAGGRCGGADRSATGNPLPRHPRRRGRGRTVAVLQQDAWVPRSRRACSRWIPRARRARRLRVTRLKHGVQHAG